MNKQTQNTNLPGPGPGRPKGSRNKVTNILKEAILEAGKNAGDGDLVAYLEKQARVLPLQVNGEIGVPDPLGQLLEDVAQNGKRIIDMENS
jgi:hypothetical protein